MPRYPRELSKLMNELGMARSPGDERLLERAIKRSLGLDSDTPSAEVEARVADMSVEERFDLIDDVQRQILVPSG